MLLQGKGDICASGTAANPPSAEIAAENERYPMAGGAAWSPALGYVGFISGDSWPVFPSALQAQVPGNLCFPGIPEPPLVCPGCRRGPGSAGAPAGKVQAHQTAQMARARGSQESHRAQPALLHPPLPALLPRPINYPRALRALPVPPKPEPSSSHAFSTKSPSAQKEK